MCRGSKYTNGAAEQRALARIEARRARPQFGRRGNCIFVPFGPLYQINARTIDANDNILFEEKNGNMWQWEYEDVIMSDLQKRVVLRDFMLRSIEAFSQMLEDDPVPETE